MPKTKFDKVEAYLFRRRAGRAEFLVLRRTPHRETLPRVWQPVTGGIERGESAFEAAQREVREETALNPKRWWALECPTVYFDCHSDTIVILPLFVAEIDTRDHVTLSDEHDSYRFVAATTAARLFLWDAQRAALAAVKRQILRGGALEKTLRIAPPVTRA